MDTDSSIHATDVKVIAVLVAVVAGLVGAIGFALNDPTIDGVRVEAPQSAHAAMLTNATHTGAPAVEKSARKPAADEPWGADESSRGSRPDATH